MEKGGAEIDGVGIVASGTFVSDNTVKGLACVGVGDFNGLATVGAVVVGARIKGDDLVRVLVDSAASASYAVLGEPGSMTTGVERIVVGRWGGCWWCRCRGRLRSWWARFGGRSRLDVLGGSRGYILRGSRGGGGFRSLALLWGSRCLGGGSVVVVVVIVTCIGRVAHGFSVIETLGLEQRMAASVEEIGAVLIETVECHVTGVVGSIRFKTFGPPVGGLVTLLNGVVGVCDGERSSKRKKGSAGENGDGGEHCFEIGG